MFSPGLRIVLLLSSAVSLTLASIAQPPPPQAQPTLAETAATAPGAILKTTTRMVTLEIVVKDHKGQHVTGLKPDDFQIFEQTPAKSKEKQEQKIAAFHEVSVADLAKQAGPQRRLLTGVNTNAVSAQKNPVPPTILLMDGLNTDVQYQLRVHAQSVKMLAQLPSDIPVAVFLLGFKLQMVQDFTSDPKLLHAAVMTAVSAAGHDFAQTNPMAPYEFTGAGSSSAGPAGPSIGDLRSSAFKGPLPDLSGPAQDIFRQLDRFQTAIYRGQMDVRVRLTANALTAIAQHVSGYPGRKNLLWLSTAFPICVEPAMDATKNHVYNRQIEPVANALSDAKIAVYPINSAGVRSPAVYDVSAPPPPSPQQLLYAQYRELEVQNRELDTMQLMADGTGGEVCTGDNDIADCVHRTVDDSSHFYEIAYYPYSKDWNGEYRRIVLNTKNKDWHLEYRQGYFAAPEEDRKTTGVRAALKRAACEGPLDATSILLTAKSLPPDSPSALKFNLDIAASTLTFTPTKDGANEVNLQLAVCTFDKKGNPDQFMSIPLDRKLTESEMQRVTASGIEDIAAVPGPSPASLRLAVMDVPSGRIGSLRIVLDDNMQLPR